MDRNELEDNLTLEVGNINADLLNAKEESKINAIIANLYMYSDNPEMLTKQYTDILNDDNVTYILTRVSQDPIFGQHFPEFYITNDDGENVINCQQNSSFHKYGVFKHTLYTIELVGNPQIPIGDWQRMLLKWTMFLHDIGKPYVKVTTENGKESFVGHDEKSVELASEILQRFSFKEEEIHIILTMIKYHDRYINEGEITFDNLKYLAQELNGRKELFYLLIDVKEADSKAKNIEVYNKYKVIKSKYLDFANKYFQYEPTEYINTHGVNVLEDPITNVLHYEFKDCRVEEDGDLIVPLSDDQRIIQKSEFDELINEVILKRKIGVLYQPIIDVENESVFSYETYTKIEGSAKLNITKFLKYAEDSNKYVKIQQSLFVNSADNFVQIKSKESNRLNLNIDLDSYEDYINKPRLYDLMEKMELIIEIHNYEKYDLATLQRKIQNIRDNKGKVLLDHFGIGSMTIDDLKLLTVDFIKPDISIIENIVDKKEKQKYLAELLTFCIARDIKLIVVGVETKEQFDLLRNMGIRYLEGFYIELPSFVIEPIGDKIHNLIQHSENDKIT